MPEALDVAAAVGSPATEEPGNPGNAGNAGKAVAGAAWVDRARAAASTGTARRRMRIAGLLISLFRDGNREITQREGPVWRVGYGAVR